MSTPSWTPKCPNHGCPLDGCGFPLPQQGTGICPVSGAPFEFSVTVDDERMVKDTDGNLTKALDWKVEGEEAVKEI